MNVMVWLTEGTWQAGVDAAGPSADVTFLHVIDPSLAAGVEGAQTALFGRGRRAGGTVPALLEAAESDLFAAAATRLGRPAQRRALRGRPEREVTAAAAGAGLLIVVRDGERSRLGPRSLAPPTRYVIDHAPCPVLLVWPEQAPALDTLPPPPPR